MATPATAVVLGGFWPTNGVNSLVSMSGESGHRRKIAMLLGKKGQMKMRELMETLDGVVAGSAALKNYGRVEANVELGGVRIIENESIVNRNTAAADVTEINTDYLLFSTRTSFGASPPANLDNNPLGTR